MQCSLCKVLLKTSATYVIRFYGILWILLNMSFMCGHDWWWFGKEIWEQWTAWVQTVSVCLPLIPMYGRWQKNLPLSAAVLLTASLDPPHVCLFQLLSHHCLTSYGGHPLPTKEGFRRQVYRMHTVWCFCLVHSFAIFAMLVPYVHIYLHSLYVESVHSICIVPHTVPLHSGDCQRLLQEGVSQPCSF